MIVSGSDDMTVRVWDLATGAPIGRPITGHTSEVCSVATAQPDGGPVIVSGGGDRTVRVWDLATGAPIEDNPSPETPMTCGHWRPPSSMAGR